MVSIIVGDAGGGIVADADVLVAVVAAAAVYKVVVVGDGGIALDSVAGAVVAVCDGAVVGVAVATVSCRMAS